MVQVHALPALPMIETSKIGASRNNLGTDQGKPLTPSQVKKPRVQKTMHPEPQSEELPPPTKWSKTRC